MLEIRQEGETSVISGSFPYGQPTLIRKGGQIIRERFEPGSLDFEGRDVSLLLAHDPNRPISNTRNGQLSLSTNDEALTFEYRLDEKLTTWAQDTITAIEQGNLTGLSPGFQVLPGGDRFEERDGIRERVITRAKLTELSIMGRPAYDQAEVTLRDDEPGRFKLWL